MKEFIYVFIGGGLGSLVRFTLSKWVNVFHNSNFPFGTFTINIIACFVLGLVIGLADQKHLLTPASRLFWAVGFCGGFSTFSAFSSETVALFQQGQNSTMLLYIFLSVVVCMTATFGGLFVAERF
jgi:fluoride exporter